MTKTYITTTSGGSGYFAVMIVEDDEGFPEPWQTGCGRYRKKSEAVEEAKVWAEAEEMEYVP